MLHVACLFMKVSQDDFDSRCRQTLGRREAGRGSSSFPLMHIQIASVKSECKLTKCFPLPGEGDGKNCCNHENWGKLVEIFCENHKRLKQLL